ncbi:hypothetical protein AOLI_G00295400 [Acnodon oligacanthus]
MFFPLTGDDKDAVRATSNTRHVAYLHCSAAASNSEALCFSALAQPDGQARMFLQNGSLAVVMKRAEA